MWVALCEVKSVGIEICRAAIFSYRQETSGSFMQSRIFIYIILLFILLFWSLLLFLERARQKRISDVLSAQTDLIQLQSDVIFVRCLYFHVSSSPLSEIHLFACGSGLCMWCAHILRRKQILLSLKTAGKYNLDWLTDSLKSISLEPDLDWIWMHPVMENVADDWWAQLQ